MPKQLADAIKAVELPSGSTTKIVAIDGGGGAGKTTLAAQLAAQFEAATVVHMDDFIHGPGAPDVDVTRLVEQVLQPLAENRPARYQAYSWDDKRLDEWHDIEPSGLVILEGVSSIRRELRDYSHYKIWISTPDEVRLQRGMARGHHSLGQWNIWMNTDAAYLQRDRSDLIADIILDGTQEYA